MKRFFIIVLILCFCNSSLAPVYAYSMLPDFLFETGVKFYNAGRYDDALTEFKKALLVKPDFQPALDYIALIQETQSQPEVYAQALPAEGTLLVPSGILTVEQEKAVIKSQATSLIATGNTTPVETSTDTSTQSSAAQASSYLRPSETTSTRKVITRPYVPKVVVLDETLKEIMMPVEVEAGKTAIIVGNDIQRFLVTSPDVIVVAKQNNNELVVTGKELGYSYVHVWDSNGRWTVDFLTTFPKPEGLTYEELRRQEEEFARSFKLYYSIDWNSFETGRRLRRAELNRTSYGWTHSLTLTGQTPYGDMDSSLNVRTTQTNTDLTYYTLGLTNGLIGPFKGFSLRGFDYSLPFSNLAFSGAQLRGVTFNSPAFNKKLDYTLFWGREGGGRFGNLSPSLSKLKNSFLEGAHVSLSPTKAQNYQFTVAHGHGTARTPELNRYGYDLLNTWNFNKWGAIYEIAHDSEHFAHTFNTHFTWPKLNLSNTFRNVDERFNTLTGSGWAQGQIGDLLTLNYQHNDQWRHFATLDIYKDRLFPAEDNPNRINQDFGWQTNYQESDDSSWTYSYTLNNDLGKLTQSRYIQAGVGYNQRLYFADDMSFFAQYYHQISTNYTSRVSDYSNDKFFVGLRFKLLDDLYYYINKEVNLLKAEETNVRSHPHSTETGVDLYKQLGESPFHTNMRFYYRDEERTDSEPSLLSGEDSIEGHLEIAYRPDGNNEFYGATTVRNIWAEKETTTKRMEATFNLGMRCMWDTGFRWDTVGSVEGYVFKDENSDGLKQPNEPPVEGAVIWLGTDQSTTTDMFGYYSFKKIKAHKAFINFDTSNLPSGFVLTVPVTQEAPLSQHRVARIDFGIISRSEIAGLVFEDTDGDGKYSTNERGVNNVTITLENGKFAVTDQTGRFTFPNAATGKHTLTLDLNSLPVYYLPKSAITKDFELFEGATFIYNIPLKKIQEE